MKAFYRIGLFLVLTLAVFFSFYFVRVFYPEKTEEARIENTLLNEQMQNDNQTEAGTENELTKESLNADVIENEIPIVPTANNAQTLTCDTVYIIKEYDKTTKTEETVYEELPEQYIGKTRRQIEEIAEAYSQAPALKDIEKGFASMEVLSFSPQKLIMQKKYYSDLTKEHFYLVVENEYVTVYYSDLQTVYLYTDIYFANLPAGLQQEILDKKYMESEEELYNFLESYTS